MTEFSKKSENKVVAPSAKQAEQVKQAEKVDEPKVVEVPMLEPEDVPAPHNPEDAIVMQPVVTKIYVPEGEFKVTNRKDAEVDGSVTVDRIVDGEVVYTYLLPIETNDDVTAEIAIDRALDRLKANLLKERK